MNTRERTECIDHALKEMWKLFDDLPTSSRESAKVNTIIKKLIYLDWDIRVKENRTNDSKDL